VKRNKSNFNNFCGFNFGRHSVSYYSWVRGTIHKTTVDWQFSGFYLFGCGLFFTPIALIPFRKGEKWAWYTALGAGGIALVGQLILVYLIGSVVDSAFLPASLMLVIL
jgi:hypothetical protein